MLVVCVVSTLFVALTLLTCFVGLLFDCCGGCVCLTLLVSIVRVVCLLVSVIVVRSCVLYTLCILVIVLLVD